MRLVRHFESGETTLETVAAQLNITPRRLRTQLSEANTSFQQILSDYRCRLAKSFWQIPMRVLNVLCI